MKKKLIVVVLILALAALCVSNLTLFSNAAGTTVESSEEYWKTVANGETLTLSGNSAKDTWTMTKNDYLTLSTKNGNATLTAKKLTGANPVTVVQKYSTSYNNVTTNYTNTYHIEVANSAPQFMYTEIGMIKGATEALKVSGLLSGDAITSATSSDTDVATVSLSGSVCTVTSKSYGMTTITVKTKSGQTATCVITVSNVSLNKINTTRFVGDTCELVATLKGGVELDSFSSDNPAVITIEKKSEKDDTVTFLLTSLSAGDATVTVNAKDGTRASCAIRVLDALEKTAAWDAEGETAKIVLKTMDTRSQVTDTPRVLFLGSLCDAHSLTGATIRDTLNKIAEKATVDYRLFGMNVSLNYSSDPVEGTLQYGTKINQYFPVETGYHVSGMYFADVINSVDLNQYDLIILEFDGVRMGRLHQITDKKSLVDKLKVCYGKTNYNYTSPFSSSTNGTTLYSELEAHFAKAAYKLLDFYTRDRVAWLIPHKEPNAIVSITEGAYYMYDDKNITRVDKDDQNKDIAMNRLYSYDTMAFISPEDWLEHKSNYTGYEAKKKSVTLTTNDSTAAQQKNFYTNNLKKYTDKCADANRGVLWEEYDNAEKVIDLIGKRTSEIADMATLELSDVITAGFEVVSVQGLYYKDGVYKEITTYTPESEQGGNFTVDFTADDAGRDMVIGHFDLKTLQADSVMMTINLRSLPNLIRGGEGDYLVEKDGGYIIETNEGDAVAKYFKAGSVAGVVNTVKTPTLDEPRLRVTKAVADGEAKSDRKLGETVNYKVTVKNVGTVTLSNITLTDEKAGISGKALKELNKELKSNTLLSGESVTLSIPCTVDTADIEAGKLVNVVSATGEDPGKNSVTGTDVNDEVAIATYYPINNATPQSAVNDNHGYITVAEIAAAGDKVPVTVTPAQGYKVTSVTYNDGEDHTITADDQGKYVFTMPAEEVTVSAEFEKVHVHNPVFVTGQAPTEEASGWKDYYECKDSDDACHEYFEDEKGLVPIPDLDEWKSEDGNGYIPPLEHTVTPVEGKDPTDTEPGYEPYYECKNCGEYYEDATGLLEIPDIEVWKAEGGGGYIPPLHGTDENHDHKCDACDEVISDHADDDHDHVCDICEEVISDHTDDDHDHKCDVCEEIISNHKDDDHDHKCDICDKVISNHKDDDHDHICDICEEVITNHVDDDKDHKCDICEEIISNHKDDDHDHKCDICGEIISNHKDDDHDHVCDVCDKVISNHKDDDHDHVCDICDKAISNHDDDDHDHKCDICGEIISNHKDDDHDHKCDICGETISNHTDDDDDHKCDICDKVISNHKDDDHDHICDICGETISNHADDNHDHVCDYCGKTVSNHTDEDGNSDHICDICGDVISNHEDNDHDHVCDICDKVISNHKDDDHDHVCDICGETISNHADDDHDHLCDYCGKAISNHDDPDGDHICNYCNEKVSEHLGEFRDGVVPTFHHPGYKDYYECDCGKYFEDVTCQVEIPDLEVWKAEGGNGYLPQLEEGLSPKTGEPVALNLWLVLLAVSAMGAAALTYGRKGKRAK